MDGAATCGRRESATGGQLAAFEPPPDEEDELDDALDDEESFDGVDEAAGSFEEVSFAPDPFDAEPLDEGSADAALFRLSVR